MTDRTMYDNEPWAAVARAVGIEPTCTESQARSVARYAAAEIERLRAEYHRLRVAHGSLKKRERDADSLLTDIEEYFDAYADGDEAGPNREAVLMQRCADWLGPVPDLASKRAALSETEGKYR